MTQEQFHAFMIFIPCKLSDISIARTVAFINGVLGKDSLKSEVTLVRTDLSLSSSSITALKHYADLLANAV
jgi:hypothetical protein